MDPIAQLPPVLEAIVGVVTFGLVFGIGYFLVIAFGIIKWLWQFWSFRHIKDTDASRGNMAVPNQLGEIVRLVTYAGYVPFGAMQRTFPRGGGSIIYHIYRSADDVYMARFPRGATTANNISITTWFTDHSVIMTDYPRGETLETDRIVNRYLRGSFAAAQAYHEARVAAWTAQGRTVMPITGMADYLQQQAYFVEHYQPLYGHPYRTVMLKLLALTLLSALSTVGLIVAIYRAEPVLIGVMIAGLALASAGRYLLMKRRRQREINRRDAADDPQNVSQNEAADTSRMM